ncbi:MAG: hypothetical protein ACRDA3_04270 [Peptostreptococcaceae bacterium]
MKKAIITLSILCGGLLIASPIDNHIFAQGTSSEIVKEQKKEELNSDDAKKILEDYNPKIEYLYQGDENTYDALKEKGLSGYVFLPNIEGDLGMFVDKSNSKVYYFHPSGYLELA